jgi:hypothetical protein
MRHVHRAIAGLALSVLLLFPANASSQDTAATGDSRFQRSNAQPVFAADQSAHVRRRSSAGRVLRNALIGAAIGATLVAIMPSPGDCRNCSPRARDILSGAMYGGFIGAAIRVAPSRRSSQQQVTRSKSVERYSDEAGRR